MLYVFKSTESKATRKEILEIIKTLKHVDLSNQFTLEICDSALFTVSNNQIICQKSNWYTCNIMARDGVGQMEKSAYKDCSSFNSKVIKSFIPEPRSRKCFSCFGIPVLCIYVMNILCTFHVFVSWVCYTHSQINIQTSGKYQQYYINFIKIESMLIFNRGVYPL